MDKNYVNTLKNDLFSDFRGHDLQELLLMIDNYFLEYREILGLPEDVTFGLELEYEKVLRNKVTKFINSNNFDNWVSKKDGSLHSGGEINTPIMTDKIKCWNELKVVCDFLDKKNADTYHNAGGHIHIGASILNDDIDAWRTFIKLYVLYENILFRFAYGDKISGRVGIFKYAPPVAYKLYHSIPAINEVKTLLEFVNVLPFNNKHSALNFKNVDFYKSHLIYRINTLEFRHPNASTKAVILQNNVNAFTKMLLSVRENVIDEEFLDYKLKHDFFPIEESDILYNEICLKQVLEFVDLIFDNNLDKVYFLRQYLKNFKNNYGINGAIKAKKFIR